MSLKPKNQVEEIRQRFEEILALRGLSYEWAATRYKSSNIQTKWRYFYLGYISNKENK
jgi:hypothetical protein